ncbi:MAG: hypothetical protein HKN29_12970, partial [Rhodothermales bacterium]|nr:hypothetical protein [Rhodothermales bacterium]
LMGIAAYLAWRAGWHPGTAAMVLGTLGLALFLAGLVAPGILRGIYPVWMALALVLGTIMTTVLLTLVFYLIVTPIGLVLRLVGKDPMHRRPDASLTTYWITRSDESNDVGRMEKYY